MDIKEISNYIETQLSKEDIEKYAEIIAKIGCTSFSFNVLTKEEKEKIMEQLWN